MQEQEKHKKSLNIYFAKIFHIHRYFIYYSIYMYIIMLAHKEKLKSNFLMNLSRKSNKYKLHVHI